MISQVVDRLRRVLVDSRFLTAVLLLSSGAALVVPALFLRNPYTVLLPGATFLAAALGLVWQVRRPDRFRLPTRRGVRWQSLFTAWLVLTAAAVALYTVSGYDRTLAVNGFLLALYLVSIAAVFLTDRSLPTLVLLLGTGLLHRAFIYFTNPLPYGVDPHYHYGNAHFIAKWGTLEPLHATKELFAPFYHLTGALASMLLGVPVRDGAMFLAMVVSITTVLALLVYHLTTSLWDERAGLLATTLFLVGDHTTGSVLSLGTTEFAMIFFVVLVYATVEYVRTNSKRYLLVFAGALFALTFTHHGTVFVATTSVAVFALGGVVLLGSVARFLYLAVLSLSVLVFSWTSTSLAGGSGDSFLGWILINLWRTLDRLFVVTEGVSAEALGYVSASPMASWGYLNVLGTGLLFFLGVVGVLYWVSVRRDDSRAIVVLLGSVITFVLVLMFVGSIVGISSLVPSRWFKHLYVLLSIFGGVGVLGLLSVVPDRFRAPVPLLVVALVLLVPYLVLMGGSLNSAVDDPVFDGSPGAERRSYTQTEVAMFDFAISYATDETDVYGDDFARGPIRWDRGDNAPNPRRLAIDLDSEKLFRIPNKTTMLINRQHMYSGKAIFDVWTSEFGTQPPITVRGETPIRKNTVEGFAKVYQASDGWCGNQSCGIFLDDHYGD